MCETIKKLNAPHSERENKKHKPPTEWMRLTEGFPQLLHLFPLIIHATNKILYTNTGLKFNFNSNTRNRIKEHRHWRHNLSQLNYLNQLDIQGTRLYEKKKERCQGLTHTIKKNTPNEQQSYVFINKNKTKNNKIYYKNKMTLIETE